MVRSDMSVIRELVLLLHNRDKLVVLSVVVVFLAWVLYTMFAERSAKSLLAAWEARDPVAKAVMGVNWSDPGIWP